MILFSDCQVFLSYAQWDMFTSRNLLEFRIQYIAGICRELKLCCVYASPINPYPSRLLHQHLGIHMMAPVMWKQNCKIWIYRSYVSTMNWKCSLKTSIAKLCAYFIQNITRTGVHLHIKTLSYYRNTQYKDKMVIFIMGISILVRQHLNIEATPSLSTMSSKGYFY